MAIHVPGKRDRRGRVGGGKRNAVAVLQLTAMVDMFTVLVVFLLQNYATTGEVINLPKDVNLPKAGAVKELKPSNVVVISDDEIMLNNDVVARFADVKTNEDWMVEPLRMGVEKLIQDGEADKSNIKNKFKQAVSDAKNGEEEDLVDEFRKITVQADKGVDFLTVKKIMYTVTEAGIYEINFAVIKKTEKERQQGI